MTIFATLMGAAHRSTEARQFILAAPEHTALQLERDPDNEFDENAIRVKSPEGLWLGFIERSIAEEMAPRMDSGTVFSCEVHMKIAEGTGRFKPLLRIEESPTDGEGENLN